MKELSPSLKEEKENGEVERLKPFVVDLGDLKAVRDAARVFTREEERLDILVNNAGL
jgi:NADP-dependent 3-hydroxy acid dehydrogenase YdfG